MPLAVRESDIHQGLFQLDQGILRDPDRTIAQHLLRPMRKLRINANTFSRCV